LAAVFVFVYSVQKFFLQIRCKEIKRADALQLKGLIGKDGEPMDGSTCGICYSIEIKDAYLPPWIVCSLCTSMCSDGMSFEARYVVFHCLAPLKCLHKCWFIF